MIHVLHGSATTNEAIRREIQESDESLRSLARRYGVNPKTIAKWKKRSSIADLPSGPRRGVSFVFVRSQESIAVAFRGHTRLPLDACLEALKPSISNLTRSSLHRCFQRHNISRTAGTEQASRIGRKSTHGRVDIAVMPIEAGVMLFAAVDRVTGFNYHELACEGGVSHAQHCMERMLKAAPHKVRLVSLERPSVAACGIEFFEAGAEDDLTSWRAGFAEACADAGVEFRSLPAQWSEFASDHPPLPHALHQSSGDRDETHLFSRELAASLTATSVVLPA